MTPHRDMLEISSRGDLDSGAALRVR
jgi:hypothetical protein